MISWLRRLFGMTPVAHECPDYDNGCNCDACKLTWAAYLMLLRSGK